MELFSGRPQNERIEKETSAEALLKAKGFEEVYVRIDDDTVDVVVNKAELTDSEIAQIEETLRKARIISADEVKNDEVSVGNTVVVFDMDFNEEDTYKIVGVIESDPDKNLVSNESPIGSALLGKKVGDIASFETPGGMVQMKIIKIS